MVDLQKFVKKAEQSMPIELLGRVKLLSFLINDLRHTDDPRAPQRIEELTAIQVALNEVLTRKQREERERRGKPEPPKVTVALKTIDLMAKAHLGEEK